MINYVNQNYDKCNAQNNSNFALRKTWFETRRTASADDIVQWNTPLQKDRETTRQETDNYARNYTIYNNSKFGIMQNSAKAGKTRAKQHPLTLSRPQKNNRCILNCYSCCELSENSEWRRRGQKGVLWTEVYSTPAGREWTLKWHL